MPRVVWAAGGTAITTVSFHAKDRRDGQCSSNKHEGINLRAIVSCLTWQPAKKLHVVVSLPKKEKIHVHLVNGHGC